MNGIVRVDGRTRALLSDASGFGHQLEAKPRTVAASWFHSSFAYSSFAYHVFSLPKKGMDSLESPPNSLLYFFTVGRRAIDTVTVIQ